MEIRAISGWKSREQGAGSRETISRRLIANNTIEPEISDKAGIAGLVILVLHHLYCP